MLIAVVSIGQLPVGPSVGAAAISMSGTDDDPVVRLQCADEGGSLRLGARSAEAICVITASDEGAALTLRHSADTGVVRLSC